MAAKWVFAVSLLLGLLASACAPKRPPTPPAPPASQNIFALLPEPAGASSAIVVRNPAGSQELAQPYQAVRVDRAGVAPSAPFTLTEPDVRRLFGPAIDVLPSPEVVFVLHFDLGGQALNADSQALIPSILTSIRERRSTVITITGHTDTMPYTLGNYALGLQRAESVATILRSRGVNASDLIVSSHGDADPLVKTAPNTDEPQNRRVEVIVR